MTATPLDIDSAQEAQGLKFKLLGPQFVSGDDHSASGTSASYSGFSAFSSVYFVVDVALRQGYREHPLTVTVEHSDDELSWSTAHAFSFSSDGSPSVTVSSPKDFVRVLWSAGVGSEWSIVSVVAVAPTTSNGGSSPAVTDGTTTVANASSIQFPKGAVSMDGAGVAVLSVMVTSFVTLTDAQIKALPTTPVELVPAPGADMLIAPILCVAAKDFGVGYTNVGASGQTSLNFCYGTNHNGAHTVSFLQELNYALFAAASVEQFPVPLGAAEDGNGGVFPPGGADLRDQPITVLGLNKDVDSNPLGDFTGGDPANTLRVLVAYAVFDLA